MSNTTYGNDTYTPFPTPDLEVDVQETALDTTDELDTEDSDVDEDEDFDEEDTADDADEPQVNAAASTKAAPKQRQRKGPDRNLMRRSARKVVELQGATPHQRTVLAAVLGSTSTDPIDLTVDVLSANRNAIAPVNDLISLAKLDPFEVSVEILSLGRPRLSAVWGLAHSLGMVEETMPSADAKAAVALARSFELFGDDESAQLQTAVELSKRQ